jgi:hypothetical protein
MIINLLIVSKRYREKWRAATNLLSATGDEIEAGRYKTTAIVNGGKPKLTVL